MRNWEGIEGWNFVFDVAEVMFSTDLSKRTAIDSNIPDQIKTKPSPFDHFPVGY